MKRVAAAATAIALAFPSPVLAQDIDFGDDSSEFARDGECDDSRFEGSGMTDTLLLDSDVGHDATDCRIAFRQGRIVLKSIVTKARPEGIDLPIEAIDFGNNESEFARDGECDDPRFVGEGMAGDLLSDSIGKDMTDCRSAFANNSVQLNALFADPTEESPINYGTDTANFANDGECDDIRFTGDYTSDMVFLVEDIGADATDCRAAVESGKAVWQGKTATPHHSE